MNSINTNEPKIYQKAYLMSTSKNNRPNKPDPKSPKTPKEASQAAGDSPLAKGKDSLKSILKSTSILSLGTLVSRILGFIRDVILATLLGTGFRADAFVVALKIPNLFRDLVGEGAINSAVVPVFSEYKERYKDKTFWNFVSVVFSLALIVLSVMCILGIIFAPILIRVIVPGFMAEPEKLAMTITLTRIMFPYLIFIGLTAYCMGLLFTFRSFKVTAFSASLLNVAIIISALIAGKTMAEPVFGLAIGVLVGGVLQLAVHIPPMLKAGTRLSVPKKFNHPGVLKIGRLLIPRVFGGGVYQLTVLVDNFCASLAAIVGAGGISAIYYANRIIQFPMGIFTIALASVILPSLSGLAHKKDHKSIKEMIVFSLENIFFVMCPTIIILLFLSNPLIRVLFERGEFNARSTEITSWALSFYAIGLFSFGGIKILVTAFHSMQDTKTPVLVAALCLMINASLNFILMVPLKIGGIALASSIAATVDFLILFYVMDKRLGGFDSDLFKYFLKVAAAALVTGGCVFWLWETVVITPEFVKLSLIGVFGIILYFFVSLAFRVDQSVKMCAFLRDRWQD